MVVNMKHTEIDLYSMEVITAISERYSQDIWIYLDNVKQEVLQEDIGKVVYGLYKAYMEDTTGNSLLDLINNKTISIKEVMA